MKVNDLITPIKFELSVISLNDIFRIISCDVQNNFYNDRIYYRATSLSGITTVINSEYLRKWHVLNKKETNEIKSAYPEVFI